MATPQADPDSIVRRIRDLARSALFQASRPALDRIVVGAMMSAASELMQVADHLEAQLRGQAAAESVQVVTPSFDVPPGRSRA